MGDSRRRLEALRRRVLADPASVAFAALAEEYRRAGRFDEAIDTARAGLDRHPAYASARVTLGRALLRVGRHRRGPARTRAGPGRRAREPGRARALADLYRTTGVPSARANWRCGAPRWRRRTASGANWCRPSSVAGTVAPSAPPVILQPPPHPRRRRPPPPRRRPLTFRPPRGTGRRLVDRPVPELDRGAVERARAGAAPHSRRAAGRLDPPSSRSRRGSRVILRERSAEPS